MVLYLIKAFASSYCLILKAFLTLNLSMFSFADSHSALSTEQLPPGSSRHLDASSCFFYTPNRQFTLREKQLHKEFL